jgi:hypothetical protein
MCGRSGDLSCMQRTSEEARPSQKSLQSCASDHARLVTGPCCSQWAKCCRSLYSLLCCQGHIASFLKPQTILQYHHGPCFVFSQPNHLSLILFIYPHPTVPLLLLPLLQYLFQPILITFKLLLRLFILILLKVFLKFDLLIHRFVL